MNADSLLTASVSISKTTYHILASRALVRARLRQWDAALAEAEESIHTWSSVLGYIAKYVALVGKGDIYKGYSVCDIASYHFHSNADHVAILLLIKAVVLSMAGEHEGAISRMDDLLAVAFLDSTLYVIQAYMYLLLGNSHMEGGNFERAIQSFKHARVKLGDHTDQPPLVVSLVSGWKFEGLAITIQQESCEALLSAHRTREACESILRMVDPEVDMSNFDTTWALDFMQRCLSTPENDDDASDQTLVPQETSYASHHTRQLLKGWARLKLMTESWRDTLSATTHSTLPKSAVYQAICENLEVTGRMLDAVTCFHQMYNELSQEIDTQPIVINWTRDFKSRCYAKLEDLGDAAICAKEYDKAISLFTAALSLNPTTPQDVLAKRSNAYGEKGMWSDALNNANEVVRLDPSSVSGYETKHAALHGLGRYGDAIEAFETMLLKMSESSDAETRERSRRYVTRQQTKEIIRTTILDTTRDSPLVLINTASGRLCDKTEQATVFELEPAFMRLISSMTTHIDHAAIKEEVENFYRYATFSHTWEENEPLYEAVVQIVVYDLEASPTHKKLQMFCKIVREAGFNWAWSDTCCINKGNHFVLQEALVSMFKWYEGSAMTIVFLLGVDRLAERGALTRSIWNVRAWTLQEYHASKVVRFYTQDWTPYLGLSLYNHKDSPEIISEMEQATGISGQALLALCPGLDDVREKLRLASTRQTTRIEDAAYSLLGIFSMTLPILYGERDKALGLLLAQLLASSGDMSVLAWTGKPNTFNSCLPASIAVFSQPLTSYVPPAIPDALMCIIIAGLRSLDLTAVTSLYVQLNALPVPSFSGRRIKLPCLAFKLGPVYKSKNVFRAQANTLGDVEIGTEEDLSQTGSLYLIHPWVDFLLDRQPVGSVTKTLSTQNIEDDRSSVLGDLHSFLGPSDIASAPRQTRAARLMSRIGRSFGSRSTLDTVSLLPPSTIQLAEKHTQALEFIARLRQPFGALLLTPTRRNVEEYRRVATGSLIRVQVEVLTPAVLDRLIQCVRMVDVL